MIKEIKLNKELITVIKAFNSHASDQFDGYNVFYSSNKNQVFSTDGIKLLGINSNTPVVNLSLEAFEIAPSHIVNIKFYDKWSKNFTIGVDTSTGEFYAAGNGDFENDVITQMQGETNFPDLDRVLNENYTLSLELQLKELLDHLKGLIKRIKQQNTINAARGHSRYNLKDAYIKFYSTKDESNNRYDVDAKINFKDDSITALFTDLDLKLVKQVYNLKPEHTDFEYGFNLIQFVDCLETLYKINKDNFVTADFILCKKYSPIKLNINDAFIILMPIRLS